MVYLLGSREKFLSSLLLSVSRGSLVPYSEGVVRGYNRVPLSIQKKFVLPGYTLSVVENFVVVGVDRINRLAKTVKRDRFSFLDVDRERRSSSSKPVFSLKKILFEKNSNSDNQDCLEPKPVIMVDCGCHSDVDRSDVRRNASGPSWLYRDIVRLPFYLPCPKRGLSIQFLIDACSVLVTSDTIDNISMAVNIEERIFQLYGITDAYWDKIHDIAATLAGKYRRGTICPLLLDGSIPSVEALLRIPRQILYKSFVGEPFDVSMVQEFLS
jgi:hypothetical protein